MKDSDMESHLYFVNESAESLTIIVEPWAEEWTINAGDEIRLIGKGPEHDSRFEVSSPW